MTHAARAVCLQLQPQVANTPEAVAATFDSLLGLTGEFDKASPGARFSRHYVVARGDKTTEPTPAQARRRVEEAQLFIDAAHAYESSKAQAAVACKSAALTLGEGTV
jgi:hypothetical protein